MSEIKLILGDCLEHMKTMPDKSVDLVIADVPYGMKYRSNHYKDTNPFNKIIGDDRFPAELIPIFKQKARKAVFVFCRWNNLPEVKKPKSFIVWVKNNWSAGDLIHEYGRMWEGILFYPLEEHAFKKRLPDVIKFNRVSPTQLIHPTEKPVYLMEWIIKNNSHERDLVFDPFMGSGTTGIACRNLNRNFIGIELDNDYFAIAKKRIENAQKQQRLFVPEQKQPMQLRIPCSAPVPD